MKTETVEQRDRRREREAASTRRYYAKNAAKANAATRRWRAENREAVNAQRRVWRSRNLVRALFLEARARAKARGIEFTIALADIPPMGDCCPLLGHQFPASDVRRTIHSPSLDRIDPAKGYVQGNVWVVGYRANLIKNDGTAEEHELIAQAMRRKLGN